MSTIRTVRSHMELFQETFSHALTEVSTQAPQPPHVTLPLRPHQLATLAAMKVYEETLRHGMPITPPGGLLFSQFAILSFIGLSRFLSGWWTTESFLVQVQEDI